MKILIISSDNLPVSGFSTSGAGLRAWGLGKGLESKAHEVIFSVPNFCICSKKNVPEEISKYAWTPGRVEKIIDKVSPDVAIFCHWPMISQLKVRLDIPTVIDFHGPHILERLYQRYGNFTDNALEKISAIKKADFFTCAGEKQKYYFIPWLMMAGVDVREKVIATVPFSLSPDLLQHNFSDELTFVYGGVFLPWQNPSLVLNTLVEHLERKDKGILKFFGGKHPIYDVYTGIFKDLKCQLEKSSKVRFYPMIPHEDLIKEYMRAYVAVDAMKKNFERELAFTSRTVEYLWCGLPVIYNNYSDLSEYIKNYKAGWVVDPEDKIEISNVIKEIIEHPEIVEEYSKNAQKLVKEKLTWDKTIEPLDKFCRDPYKREVSQSFIGEIEKRRHLQISSENSPIKRGIRCFKEQGTIYTVKRTLKYIKDRI